ncbi:FimV/HubP family polar landmark protein [Achromobacter xylosoxidans]
MQARRLKALQWAVALALGTSVCGSAYAMRVGHSRVVSVPGAPLQAVVGLQELTPDEIASLRVSVADEAAWQRAGLKPPVPLADLVVGVENGMDATRKNLRVRSSQAPASGAVDLLLDISSSAGQRQVQVSILVPLRGAGADATPASVGGKARAGASAGGATLNVKPGDTLYAIAQRNAVPGASIYQMLVALWRANPQAFIQSNMNLLKAGQKLSIPDADAVRAIDPAEARRIFNEHAEAFAKYRSRLGAAGANPTVVKGQSAASGTVSRSGDTGAASAASAQDRLRLSNGQDGGGASRRPGRCQGVRRTRDGRCAGAGDYVAGQRGRVEQGGGRAGRGRTGRCDGRWRRSGIGGGCRRCGCLWLCGCCGLDGGRWGGWIWRCGRRVGTAGSAAAAGGAGAAGSTGATGAAGAAGSTAATGAAGSAGTTGAAGAAGSSSAAGAAGVAGAAASVGAASGAAQAAASGASAPEGKSAADQKPSDLLAGAPSWLTDNLLVIVTAVLALLVFIIAWALRRAGARRGDDDEETYAYAEPALDTTALNRKLETISLDLDEPPSDEPRRPGAPKA